LLQYSTNISQQPTDFWLHTYTIDQVFDSPALISSLAQYSGQREGTGTPSSELHGLYDQTASVLFLRIQAAASYYSTNRTLMVHPEPVDVDISMSWSSLLPLLY
jgi:hypothetical protein